MITNHLESIPSRERFHYPQVLISSHKRVMYETQRALINQRRGGSRWLRRHGEARSLRSEKGLKRTLGVIARRATNCGTVCTRGIISISIWARNGEGDAGRVLVTGCSSRDMRGRIILHVRRFLIYESTAQCAVFKTYLS